MTVTNPIFVIAKPTQVVGYLTTILITNLGSKRYFIFECMPKLLQQSKIRAIIFWPESAAGFAQNAAVNIYLASDNAILFFHRTIVCLMAQNH